MKPVLYSYFPLKFSKICDTDLSSGNNNVEQHESQYKLCGCAGAFVVVCMIHTFSAILLGTCTESAKIFMKIVPNSQATASRSLTPGLPHITKRRFENWNAEGPVYQIPQMFAAGKRGRPPICWKPELSLSSTTMAECFGLGDPWDGYMRGTTRHLLL